MTKKAWPLKGLKLKVRGLTEEQIDNILDSSNLDDIDDLLNQVEVKETLTAKVQATAKMVMEAPRSWTLLRRTKIKSVSGWSYPFVPKVTLRSLLLFKRCDVYSGDLYCGFCENLLAVEGDKIELGYKCRHCQAKVVGIKE